MPYSLVKTCKCKQELGTRTGYLLTSLTCCPARSGNPSQCEGHQQHILTLQR
jgi:hypothetical protein